MNSVEGLSYLLHKSKISSTADGNPLLILLHGVGSNEADLFAMAPQLDARFNILSVRAPITLGPSAFGWYHIQYGANGITYDARAVEHSRAMLERFVPEVAMIYGANASQTYLMGFSQGAVMTYTLLRTAPVILKGAVIMSGRPTPESEMQATSLDELTGKSAIVTHGIWDDVLPISCGRETRDILAESPLALSYHEYQMGHTVNSECFDDVQRWLTSQLNSTRI